MSTFANFRKLLLDAKFTIGAEAANVRNVSVQFVDRENGNALASRAGIAWYLADDANGDTPSATAPSGGIAIGTNGALIEWAVNLSGVAISEATGIFDVNITEVGVKSYYLILVMPDGKLVPSGAIAFA